MLRKKKKGGKRRMIDAIIFQLSEHSRFDPYQDTSGWYPRYESKESPPQRSKQIPSIERDLDFGRRGRSGIKRSTGREMESFHRFSRSDFIVLLCFPLSSVNNAWPLLFLLLLPLAIFVSPPPPLSFVSLLIPALLFHALNFEFSIYVFEIWSWSNFWTNFDQHSFR